jgi:molybdopterin-guanine dinucleotide biosynthesis protein A
MTFDAIVLTGGRARRLGGLDKAALVFDGSTFLERALLATSAAERIICVGPQVPTSAQVLWTREDPPLGGPAAAVVAGLALVEAPVTMVLSVDAPLVTREVVDALVSRCTPLAASLLADVHGVPQMLIGAYPSALLTERAILLGELDGLSVRHLVEGIPYVSITEPDAASDCDTWDDVENLRRVGG